MDVQSLFSQAEGDQSVVDGQGWLFSSVVLSYGDRETTMAWMQLAAQEPLHDGMLAANPGVSAGSQRWWKGFGESRA